MFTCRGQQLTIVQLPSFKVVQWVHRVHFLCYSVTRQCVFATVLSECNIFLSSYVEALMYLIYAYQYNKELLLKGLYRGHDEELLGHYRRECLLVSPVCRVFRLKQSDFKEAAWNGSLCIKQLFSVISVSSVSLPFLCVKHPLLK